MAGLLLQTKLHIPPVRPDLVPRPHLAERLDAGVRGKLTLVSAPAGFGQTTLVANWPSQIQDRESGPERPAAWLSLDENDNDPARFFSYLVTALQTVDASIGQTALGMMQTGQPPSPESLLISLINDIADTSGPFILVLDDYHLIQTLPIHQQLAFLLEHQPPLMHLVIVTREAPPLPLSRRRARGEVVETRQADFRYTAE